MRLSIILSAGYLILLGLNLPVMSQPPIEIAQSPVRTSLNQRKLQFNRRLWEKQNILNYRYTFSNGCFCIPDARGPVVIEVRNGKTRSITSVETGLPVTNPEFFANYNTIPKLFNVIQDAIARQAFNLDVNYSARYGHPTQINIDYNAQIADEELYLTIDNFQVLR
ncbi:hypothetical protein H6G33_27020 [Calothrix sp. FACHB-1219]|uniref:DUF6174 domain-containing protein n=1 Tax=unclassified Calothrix TaxID=2619626 RepID=UPI0016830BC5|nr:MULTISPECIES: DUF6174 domain-containing protein [unclassified Calothrix]MBD2205832.1 hypothetical protein [Calothrix sp. FACHB-168]MBD2220661.1 hypothetical protein [Calothrix sp. FACHB-1219]